MVRYKPDTAVSYICRPSTVQSRPLPSPTSERPRWAAGTRATGARGAIAYTSAHFLLLVRYTPYDKVPLHSRTQKTERSSQHHHAITIRRKRIGRATAVFIQVRLYSTCRLADPHTCHTAATSCSATLLEWLRPQYSSTCTCACTPQHVHVLPNPRPDCKK